MGILGLSIQIWVRFSYITLFGCDPRRIRRAQENLSAILSPSWLTISREQVSQPKVNLKKGGITRPKVHLSFIHFCELHVCKHLRIIAAEICPTWKQKASLAEHQWRKPERTDRLKDCDWDTSLSENHENLDKAWSSLSIPGTICWLWSNHFMIQHEVQCLPGVECQRETTATWS